MATNTSNPNPHIVNFTVTPAAVGNGGTVELRAKLSMTEDELQHEGVSFQFLAPDNTPITPAFEKGHPKAVGQWIALPPAGTKPSHPIEHREFRAQILRKDVVEHEAAPQRIVVVWIPTFDVVLDETTAIEGDPVNARAGVGFIDDDFASFDIGIAWTLDGRTLAASANPAECPIDTTGLQPGIHHVAAKLVGKDGQVVKGDSERGDLFDSVDLKIDARAPSRTDVFKVALQKSSVARTRDQVLWSLIRDRTIALSFMGGGYKTFIDTVLANPPAERSAMRRLAGPAKDLPINPYGMAGYDLLKTATEAFMLMHCGAVVEHAFEGGGYDPDAEAARLGERMSVTDLKNQLTRYFQHGRLPYLDRVIQAIFPEGRTDVGGILPGALSSRVAAPCMLELIWSYWHEEGMLVQTMNAISRRFQNVRGPGDRDPLAHLEIDPLRPLNNVLWGYIQDEQNLLTVKRRAYEYDHQYGLATFGKAVPPLRPADSRSKFLEGFHNLLHVTSVFYKEDNDTTVIADGFPLLNALREVHLVLAQGAHNQFGDLPWTARGEMLMQQWLLSRPEMREFLQSRAMVPYKEPWMAQVDTMKTLQGWSDVTVTHFRDLGTYGEQILLSIRYGDWIDINDEDSAKNWARYWRPEIQSYIHAYRTVTGIDLINSDTVDYTMPAVHLQKRLAMQRTR